MFNASVILSIIVHFVISFVIFKGNVMVSKVVFCVTHCWVEVKFVLSFGPCAMRCWYASHL